VSRAADTGLQAGYDWTVHLQQLQRLIDEWTAGTAPEPLLPAVSFNELASPPEI